jgi:hypothetical protein
MHSKLDKGHGFASAGFQLLTESAGPCALLQQLVSATDAVVQTRALALLISLAAGSPQTAAALKVAGDPLTMLTVWVSGDGLPPLLLYEPFAFPTLRSSMWRS